jgi:molybdopterin converting factor subunit 1
MIINVRLFARARDLAGVDVLTVELADGAVVGDLRRALSAKDPSLGRLVERSALAVNSEFVDDSWKLSPHAEVALLPPVSGG